MDEWLKLNRWMQDATSYCIVIFSGEKSYDEDSYRKIQQRATVYQNLLFHIYMKLNMFWATHHPLTGA
jgi:hypothetical protein